MSVKKVEKMLERKDNLLCFKRRSPATHLRCELLQPLDLGKGLLLNPSLPSTLTLGCHEVLCFEAGTLSRIKA
jgi:hypothetical protein